MKTPKIHNMKHSHFENPKVKQYFSGFLAGLVFLGSNAALAETDSTRLRSMAQWERNGAVIFSWERFVPGLFEASTYGLTLNQAANKTALYETAKCEFIKTTFDAILDAGASIVVTDSVDMQFENTAHECNVDISKNVTVLSLDGDGTDDACSSIWARDKYPFPVYENNHGTRVAVGLETCSEATDALGIKSAVLEDADLPLDFVSFIASLIGIEVEELEEELAEFQTSLVSAFKSNVGHTYTDGGNYMTNGQGLLILENGRDVEYIPEAFEIVDQYFEENAGITDFIKLPYFNNHVDYAVKLLNEETVVLSKPTDLIDDDYVDDLEFYNSVKETLSTTVSWTGRPYNVIDLPEISIQENEEYATASVSFYANSLIVNDTVLVGAASIPGVIDHEGDDAEIKRIYEEAMPGYKIVMLPYSSIVNDKQGGIHCLTAIVGDEDPVYIAHKWLDGTVDNADGGYVIEADVGSVHGINTAKVLWREEGQNRYKTLRMRPTSQSSSSNEGVVTYSAKIPKSRQGTTIEYFIQVKDNNRKQENMPLVAPKSNYSFTVGE